MTRAKMHLVSVNAHYYGGKTLTFAAQYDTTIPEDQRFSKATPTASATFQIDNPAALEQFTVGKFYYFDISEVPNG